MMPDMSINEINRCMNESPENFISLCEKQYDDRLNSICDRLIRDFDSHCFVMVAGPSSSGKTTTSSIIRNKLINSGRSAKVISLDDFYRNQDVKFTFEDGTVDYETIKALDVDYISECLQNLMKNGSCMLPRFNFITKTRESYSETILDKDEIVIVEGLHALNPAITDPLEGFGMRKLYVSVSSRITDGDKIHMSKRDIRLVRRMIRDYHFRGSSIETTFYLWNGVRMGEDRYLFPFSDRADEKIDSIHPYEMCIFKDIAIKLLDRMDKDSIYYPTACELRNKLSVFESYAENLVPQSSLLREFIGHSVCNK